MQIRYAYIVEGVIVEFRVYDEGIEVDPVMLRPVVVVPYTLEPWQVVIGVHYEIFEDHVDEIADLQDKPLGNVQRERVAALEELFLQYRAYGFQFQGYTFALLQQSTERMELVRRGAYVVSSQIDIEGRRVAISETDINNWLTAADDALTALYVTYDNHFVGIMATTTPQEAGSYDISTGWPALPPAGPDIPEE